VRLCMYKAAPLPILVKKLSFSIFGWIFTILNQVLSFAKQICYEKKKNPLNQKTR